MKPCKPGTPTLERLIAYTIVDRATGCFVWVGGCDSSGYGSIVIARKTRSVHRVGYELLRGDIPARLELDHLCRNRTCWNPAHLEPVTKRENVRRGRKGVLLTHCPHGHAYTAENTLISGGRTICRECGRIGNRKRYHQKKINDQRSEAA